MAQRNIGIIDVDSHNFPNFALMRVSAYYKSKGYDAERAVPSKNMISLLQARYSPSLPTMTIPA